MVSIFGKPIRLLIYSVSELNNLGTRVRGNDLKRHSNASEIYEFIVMIIQNVIFSVLLGVK